MGPTELRTPGEEILGKPGGYVSNYQGKGQRLDCFLLSPSNQLLESVSPVTFRGMGSGVKGCFVDRITAFLS
jgi:hypothetical protein